MLAARGARDMGDGVEAIDDAEEVAFLKRRARSIHLRSLVVALVLTGLGVGLGEYLHRR